MFIYNYILQFILLIYGSTTRLASTNNPVQLRFKNIALNPPKHSELTKLISLNRNSRSQLNRSCRANYSSFLFDSPSILRFFNPANKINSTLEFSISTFVIISVLDTGHETVHFPLSFTPPNLNSLRRRIFSYRLTSFLFAPNIHHQTRVLRITDKFR